MDDQEEIIDIGEDNTVEQDNAGTFLELENKIEQFAEDWIEATPRGPEEMDEETRTLIEQMLAEEEFYYGASTLPAKRKPKHSKDSSKISKKAKTSSISSVSLPSHKTRWTESEDALLRSAVEQCGHGNWKAIADIVKTRNALQCKNRAKHLSLNANIPAKKDTASTVETITKPPQDAPSDNKSQDDDDEEISIEDDDLKPEITPSGVSAAINNDDNTQDDESPSQPSVIDQIAPRTLSEDDVVTDKDELVVPEETISATKETDEPSSQSPSTPIKTEDFSEESKPEGNLSTDQEIPKQIPKDENDNTHDQLFDRYSISEEEKQSNPEWFKNRQSKTPDRYLKIRNHILDCWEKCKPRYLTKTGARRGLKDCGDVNAIGRVHSYLESVGAINVGCINEPPRPPKRVAREIYDDDEPSDMLAAADLVINYEGPRKRKVRNEAGEWVDPKELEGRVIEHGKPQVQSTSGRPKRVIKRPQHYTGGDEFSRGYDPFRLVPVEYYNDQDRAPFTVEIQSDCLLVMDFHSHLAHTEIIGLLGGKFHVDGDVKTLRVESVFPCRSTSTGIQCEMDPASEMKAREFFSEKGYDVVGWYHSHPTFEPHPSIRDIENQTSYQTLFRHEQTGDEPFIGVIVTPYDPDTDSDHSQIQYLHISPRYNETRLFRVPYACKRVVRQTNQVSPDVLQQFKSLTEEFKDYEHKINMTEPFKAQTRLDKLLDSLRSNVFLPVEETSKFLDQVRQLMTREFISAESSSTTTAAAAD